MKERAPRHARSAGRAFVGREAELSALRAGLADALGGRGRLLLVVGEPGIGKTRLAEQLAGHAVQAGAVVQWGRCWDGGGAPAYWPWIQIIRAHIQHLDDHALRAQLGVGAADIAQVVLEVAERLPGLSPPAPLGAEQARFRLFDSATRLLINAAAAAPQVLILDDLHAADVSSLRLLTFLAQDLPAMPVLIVGTYRDVEATQDPAVDRVLTRLARAGQQLHLRGLGETDVARLIEDTTGVRASGEMVAAVHQTTAGNPLFTAAVADLLARQGSLGGGGLPVGRFAIPQEVRGAIRQRLDRLSEQAGRVLTQAAVIGQQFDLALLARVADVPPEGLEGALTEALGWGILVESTQMPGRLAFSHDLVRRVLSTQLPPHQRAALHRTVGLALEKLHADAVDPPLAQLAHHFVCAAEISGDDGDVAKAIDYTQRAGDRAIARLAYEDAVANYAQALRLLKAAGGGETHRLELLLKHADAQKRAGDVAGGRKAWQQAIELAKRLREPEQLTRAVLGLVGVPTELWSADETRVALLEEALGFIGEDDPRLRAMLLAQLAIELYWSEAGQRTGPLSLEALRLARSSGDPVALARVLHARHQSLWGPDHLDERLAIASEHIHVATQARDNDMVLAGRRQRVIDLLEQGRIAEADRELEVHDRLGEEVRDPAARWYSLAIRGMRAFMAGRFDEAERLAQAAHSTGNRLERSDASGIYTAQMVWVLRERGDRLEELEPMLDSGVERYPWRPSWRAGRASFYASLGRMDAARREFEFLAADQFACVAAGDGRLPTLTTLAFLADVCAYLCDQRRAGELYGLLLPYADQHITGGGYVSYGAASRYLGLLARTTGQHRLARSHFEAALEANRRMGALPWAAHTQHEYAELLLDHGEAKDQPAGLGLLSEALDTANTVGMTRLADAVSARLAAFEPGGGRPPSSAPADPTATGVFRRQGEYWAITYGDRSFLLKNMKGLGYLACLLADPDRELHALDLVRMERPAAGARGAAGQPETSAPGFGDAGELLDRQAQTAYRRRLTELNQELDVAADPEHTARLQTEIDFLARELATAVGLGGRDRKAASAAERARLNVTHRIRAAIRKIAVHHPPLGRHLDSSVRTGAFCCYRPDPAARISWTI
ncbi:MAG: ATP-binding protein [Egibacteraceae bacterium]